MKNFSVLVQQLLEKQCKNPLEEEIADINADDGDSENEDELDIIADDVDSVPEDESEVNTVKYI